MENGALPQRQSTRGSRNANKGKKGGATTVPENALRDLRGGRGQGKLTIRSYSVCEERSCDEHLLARKKG